jgi:hypothetical protein
MGSANSMKTGTISDVGSSQSRKRKRDARSGSGVQLSSAKRASRSKTDDLNPVIISNALNSTLNRIADVMERSLDATAVVVAPPGPTITPTTSTVPPSINTSSVESQPPAEILDEAIRLISTKGSGLSEDELYSASLFFSSGSDSALRTARTFIALGNDNQSVQNRFLRRHLEIAGLLPGKGKGKATEDDDDDDVMYQ